MRTYDEKIHAVYEIVPFEHWLEQELFDLIQDQEGTNAAELALRYQNYDRLMTELLTEPTLYWPEWKISAAAIHQDSTIEKVRKDYKLKPVDRRQAALFY